MNNSKILILLPDGMGLRNFVFSDFPKLAHENELELLYWNATSFDLSKYNLNSIGLSGKIHYKTDLLKRARKQIEIRAFSQKFNNDIFFSYLFKTKPKSFKSLIKKYWVKKLVFQYKNNPDILRHHIKIQERNTEYYKACINQLRSEQPDMVFCTNQRPVVAIAPILAAQELNIPTATFIFSWDNIPKATMVVETDYYFVWSDYMAKELKAYYPYIKSNQIIVTGSPQFEVYHKSSKKLNKAVFCRKYNLPANKNFICFSGDDITTSPHDPEYLNDICEAIKILNKRGHNFNIIFRPCPVDFSSRYDKVLEKHKDVAHTLRPLWKEQGVRWNTILPTRADEELLYNTILHSELVINLGSSMVFDAVCHKKACAYINYNPNTNSLKKDVNRIYRYIHFQSMPSKSCVIWLNSKEELSEKILNGIHHPGKVIKEAKKWFKVINRPPENLSSQRIVNDIKNVLNK